MNTPTMNASYWREKQATLTIIERAFINGEFVDAVDQQTFDCINPATQIVLAQVSACGEKDVNLAVKIAKDTFQSGVWANCSLLERKQVLKKLAQLILENREELALLESLDMGKPVSNALQIDVEGAAACFEWYAETIDKQYGEVAPTDSDSIALVTREAIGVVAAVIPWNFPLDMAAWKLAPALAMGNSVILKPAEQSPLSALKLAELCVEAGLPDGVLSVLPGAGEVVGKALGLHPDVDCVAFTGSTAVGKLFLQYAGQSNMKRIWLECGGKSANLIFNSCDLDAAVDKAIFGIFHNQGEVCSANSRILVQQDIYAQFCEKFVHKAKQLQVGDPLDSASDLGAIVDQSQANQIRKYIDIGKKEGAACLLDNSQPSDSPYISPIIFANVDNHMTLAKEEVFGPLACILAFSNEEDAISQANDSIYGLAASIWSHDLSQAHRVAKRLQAGTVSINTVDALSLGTPFGGYKQSGIGRDLSLHAIDKYSELKTTWIQL